MNGVDRRTLLAMGGSAAVGAVIGGLSVGAVVGAREETPTAIRPTERRTFPAWRASRRAPYYIAHRGAGDVAPEHTMPAYETALNWGAEVIEISVVRSADNDLYCLHDLTLDRTTASRGPAALTRSEALDRLKVDVPRLGPRWLGPNSPTVPRLADVLEVVGGRAVLAIEAKDDSAYPLMVKMIEDAGLSDTVMLKMTAGNPRIAMAKASSYPVFAYFGNVDVATSAAIEKVGAGLDPAADALVLPARGDRGIFSESLTRRAVQTGIPVWVAPVHRRYEVKLFSRLGVEGFITPDLGYLTGAEPRRQVDDWASGGLSAGELTRDPYNHTFALDWQEEGVIGLDFDDRASFVCLGQFSPIESDSFRITFDAAFDPLPTDTWQQLSLAFGHADDRYYEHRLGESDGFHAQLRADGSMAVYAHVEGDPNGQILTPTKASTPLKAGLWSRLTLDVTPELIRWSRDDGTVVETRDRRRRGGYLHIGRSGTDGMLKLRNFSVT